MTDQVLLAVLVLAATAAGLALWWVLRRRRSGGVATPTTKQVPDGLGSVLRRVWGQTIDEDTWDRLEEALQGADVGVGATTRIVSTVRARRPTDVATAERLVAEAVLAEFGDRDRSLHVVGSPAVVLVVGVNGSGKTTTIAKLARRLLDGGRSVRLAAADTFRAAAVEQLAAWGERLGVPVTTGPEGADPASVAHEAITTAATKGEEVVIVDTAGRLHSKRNLMDELGKVHRVSAQAGSVAEVLLVLDATSGQNGLAQVREFSQAVPVSGVVLTKLDGTARGGIVVAVESELGVPVKLVGTGEGLRDLSVFDPETFVADLTAR